MRLLRPYIPIAVRRIVLIRQLKPFYGSSNRQWDDEPYRRLLSRLSRLFGGPLQLDHDPALENREKVFVKGVHVDYSPAANDSNYLIYREKHAHKIKTLVRGDGAQYSDAALARKNKRIARNRDPKRRRYKWPKRRVRRVSDARRKQ